MRVGRASNNAASVGAQRATQVTPGQTGLEPLVRGLEQAGDFLTQEQEKVDVARAKEVDSEYSSRVREILYQDGDGFLNSLGKNSVDGRDTTVERLKNARDELLGGLSGGASKRAKSSMQARFEQASTRVDSHTSTQRKTYLNDAANARVGSAISDAIFDPAQVEQSLKTVVEEAQDAGQRNGHSKEVIMASVVKAQTEIHSGIVKRLAAADPIAAAAYLHDNKTKMLGSEVATLTAKLQPIVKAHRGRNIGKSVFQSHTGSNTTLNMIKKHEGFRSGTYWDVNAHRLGFGSDTITRADGSVVKVKKGDTVTRADAERDLQRRAVEFERTAIKNVGLESWARLPDNAKAALVSLTYNYGEIPERIRGAIATGDTSVIAAAVERLGSDNGGINRKRRSLEAAEIRSGKSKSVSALQQIVDIEDVTEREAALTEYKMLNSVVEAEEKQVQARSEQSAFEFVESGGSVDDIPFDTRIGLGQDAISSLRTYQDKLATGEKIQTDTEEYVRLSELSATSPQEFAEINPLNYRNQLDDGDFERFVKVREDILSGNKKTVSSPTVSNLRTAASSAIKAAGLDGKSKFKQKAEFERTLLEWSESFTQQNNKIPTPIEIDTKINQLLTPVVIDTVGWGGIDERAFEIDFDGEAIDPNDDLTLSDVRQATVKINNQEVETHVLERFISGFTDALGRPPSSQEVIEGLIESELFE